MKQVFVASKTSNAKKAKASVLELCCLNTYLQPAGNCLLSSVNIEVFLSVFTHILGEGTGGYEKAFVDHVKDQEGQENFIHHDPHNQFLKIFAELGIMGLVSFLRAALFQRTTPFYFDLSLGVLLAWCGTSLFSSHFSTFTEVVLFIFI